MFPVIDTSRGSPGSPGSQGSPDSPSGSPGRFYHYGVHASKGSQSVMWSTKGSPLLEDFLYPSLTLSSPESSLSSSSSMSSPSPSPLKWNVAATSSVLEPAPSPTSGPSVEYIETKGEHAARQDWKDKYESEAAETRALERRKIAAQGKISLKSVASATTSTSTTDLVGTVPDSSVDAARDARGRSTAVFGILPSPEQLTLRAREASGEEVFMKLMRRRAQVNAMRLIFNGKPAPGVSVKTAELSEEEEERLLFLKHKAQLGREIHCVDIDSDAGPSELTDSLLFFRIQNEGHSLAEAGSEDDGDGDGDGGGDSVSALTGEGEGEGEGKDKDKEEEAAAFAVLTRGWGPAAPSLLQHKSRVAGLNELVGDEAAAYPLLQSGEPGRLALLAGTRVGLPHPLEREGLWGGDTNPTVPNPHSTSANREQSARYLATLREKQAAQDALSLAQMRAGITPEPFIARATSHPRNHKTSTHPPPSASAALGDNNNNNNNNNNNTTILDLSNFCIGNAQGHCLGLGLRILPSLCSLLLRDNRLSRKSLKSICHNASPASLTHLDLSCNDLSGAGPVLAALFRRPNALQHLDISSCCVGDVEFELLCRAFDFERQEPSALAAGAGNAGKTRDASFFRRNAIASVDDNSSRIITHVTQESPAMHLRTLLAAKNSIGQVGVAALSCHLSNQHACQTLKTVNLCWNNVASPAASLIADAINRNPFIQLASLDLSCNSISELGGENLAAMLYCTTRLESLLLSQNQVSNRACFVFSKALKNHPSMKVLDLSLNPLGNAGARCLFRTILDGLRCFVMMRECSFSTSANVFNFNNPALDSPYTLDMSKPYDCAVAQELVHMAETNPSHCRIESVVFGEGKVMSVVVEEGQAFFVQQAPAVHIGGSGLHGAGGRDKLPWRLPPSGRLVIRYQFSMTPPGPLDCASNSKVKLVQLIVNGGRTEADRRNWLKLLCSDLVSCTSQAQDMIDFFVAKQVIGLGGLSKVDVISSVWARLLDTENMFDLLMCNLDQAGRYKVLYNMTFELFKFNWVNPTGTWRLNLGNPQHRNTVLKLVAINEKESSFSRLHSGRGDTSQNGDWTNFRNVRYFKEGQDKSGSGKKSKSTAAKQKQQQQQQAPSSAASEGEEDEDEDRAGDDAGGNDNGKGALEVPFLMSGEFVDKLPLSGFLVFDYVSTRRPGEELVLEQAARGHSGPSGEQQQQQQQQYTGDSELGLDRDRAEVGLDFFADALDVAPPSPSPSASPSASPPFSASAVSAATPGTPIPTDKGTDLVESDNSNSRRTSVVARRGSVMTETETETGTRTGTGTGSGENLNRDASLIISDDDFLRLMDDLGLSLRERCQPPQTMFVLLFLQFASTKFYFTTKRVCVLMDTFSSNYVLQARLVSCLFSRIWDLHNFDAVMRHMSTKGQREVISRLGILNVMNPLKPALDYRIDMRHMDQRVMLVYLLQVAPTEASDQIREDPNTELSVTTMYGAINRVLSTPQREVLLFNFGEVGERAVSNFVSWNIRREALDRFLVGTKPVSKGVFDVVRMYGKLAQEGELSVGPIELQYEAYAKKKAAMGLQREVRRSSHVSAVRK